jgi:hypothetical protein
MDGGDLMIAMPHLLFLTVVFAAGLVAWVVDLGEHDTVTAVAGTIVAGLGAGVFLAAWAA